MAKASAPGVTKTRLSPPLSLEAAAESNTAFLRDVAANLAAAQARADLAGYVAYGPSGAENFFEATTPDLGRFECWGGDLTETIPRALDHLLALGHRAAVVMNADSPTLPTDVLVEAAEVLAAHPDRLVLGPCDDGGYYLLGACVVRRELFEGVAWSTGAVFEQTVSRAEALGIEVHRLRRWYDVDDAAGLATLRGELLEGRAYAPGAAAWPSPHSAALLRRLEC